MKQRVVKKIISMLLVFLFSGSMSLFGEKIKKMNLDDSVSLALKNSVALVSLRTKMDVSRRLILEKWRNFLPEVTLRYSKEDTVSYHEDDYRNQSATVDMGYDLHSSGKTIIEYKITKIESMLAEQEYRIERNNIILKIKKIFYQLFKNLDEIEINKKLLESLMLQKKIIDTEQSLGMATRLQRIQVEARIREAKYNILRAENEFKNTQKDFKILIGFPTGPELALERPEMDIEDMPVIDMKKDKLIAIAFRKRSEFQKSRYMLYKTKKEMELARHYYLPKVRLTGSYGYTGENYPPEKRKWNVGISISTAIFGNTAEGSQNIGKSEDGNTRNSSSSGNVGIFNDPSYLRRIIESKSSSKEANLSHSLLKKSIHVEVVRAHDSLLESTKMVQIANENVKLLEEQVKIENAKVSLGEITRYDILKNYIELSKARLRELSAKTEYLISIATLERAVGFNIGKLMRKK